MGESNDALEEIQNEINKELENLGVSAPEESPEEEIENALSDESLDALEDGFADVEASQTQKIIADELEAALNGAGEEASDNDVDDALGEIESMMESADAGEIETETVADVEEVSEEPFAEEVMEEPVAEEEVMEEPVAEEEELMAEEVTEEPVAEESFDAPEEIDTPEEDGVFNESELDEIMSEIDEFEENYQESDNVIPMSKGGGEVPMSFSASGEMETELKFTLAGKEISFCVNKTNGFIFQMDNLTVTVDEKDQVVVNLGGGMKLTAPLDGSAKSGKKEAA